MLESVCQGTDPDFGVPVFTGRAERRALVALFGLPNAAPMESEIREKGRYVLALVSTRRELYVDDDQDGKPMAVWLRKEGVCRL